MVIGEGGGVEELFAVETELLDEGGVVWVLGRVHLGHEFVDVGDAVVGGGFDGGGGEVRNLEERAVTVPHCLHDHL